LLHGDTAYPAGSRVLEVGCGVGAQTLTLAANSPDAAITAIDIAAARAAIACQVELQRRAGGDAMIGRALYPLLIAAGYRAPRVSPRMVYVDGSRPDLIEGFTKRTFTAMIAGVREPALATGLTDAAAFDQGIRDLYRTAEADGVFCYTFFKAVAGK